MKVLVDTNVILDVLLEREPFCKSASKVLKLSGRDNIQEFVSAAAITDIYYIAYQHLRDKQKVRDLIKQLLRVVSVASVSEKKIVNALELEWNDFEDSVQYSVATLDNMDAVVTRNGKDYKMSEVPVWTPDEMIENCSE